MKATKKPYAAPEMEVVYFTAADVLYGEQSDQTSSPMTVEEVDRLFY
jgi:hypothetical protein